MRFLQHEKLVDYDEALAFMGGAVAELQSGAGEELIWLLEHAPLYTAGISAKDKDLLQQNFPIYESKRGGQYTYHGPGQRVGYAMLNLAERGRDVRAYVNRLQEWLIAALAEVGVSAFCRAGRVGLWVYRDNIFNDNGYEDKIAAIGVRVQRWVTSHGFAVNVCPNLEHFSGIVPCGIDDERLGVTSLQALGVKISLVEFDEILKRTCPF